LDSAFGAAVLCVFAAAAFSSAGGVALGIKGAVSCAGTGWTFLNRDLLCLIDKIAKLRQVIKNKIDNTVVVRVRNAFVFVPSIDSTSWKLSAKPPPLPLCIRIRIISKVQAITCIVIKKAIILNEHITYGAVIFICSDISYMCEFNPRRFASQSEAAGVSSD